MTAHIPTLKATQNDGAESNEQLGKAGDLVCNEITAYKSEFGDGGEPFVANERVLANATEIDLSLADEATGEAYAIMDICPSFQSIIPYGDPGAS